MEDQKQHSFPINLTMTTMDTRMGRFSSFEKVFLLVIAVLLVGIQGYRTTLGVDFTDESYHIANAYKFFLGAVPFKDEQLSGQSFGLLTKPIVSVFILLTGSTEGLVLKMRWAFLFFQCFLSFFLFSILKRTFNRSLAFAACLSYFCFVPMNLFSLFYVSLGVGFLALGMGCFYLASLRPEPSRILLLGSMALSFSLVAHPVMALPIAWMTLFISWPFDSQGLKRFFTVVGSFIFTIAVFCWVYRFTPADWIEAIQVTRKYNESFGNIWGYQRVLFALKTMVMWGPWLGFILFTFAFLIFTTLTNSSCKTAQFILLSIFPAMMFLNSRASHGGIGPAAYPLSLGWLSLILIGAILPRQEAKRYFLWFLIPAVMATLAMSYTSNAGVGSTSTGFLPILPLALILFVSAIHQSIPRFFLYLKPYATSFVIAFFLFLFMRNTFQTAFGEPSFSALNHSVTSGPYRGLKTTTFKKNFIEQLQNQLGHLKKDKNRILFTCFFPAGYLLTDLQPGYYFVWSAPGNGDHLFDSDLLVRILDESYPLLGIVAQTCQPLRAEISGKKGRLVKEKYYEIGLF